MADDTKQAPLSPQAAKRTMARIAYELETIREEGLDSPRRWYAQDRFAAIAEIAQAAADGDELACRIGIDAPPEFFNRE